MLHGLLQKPTVPQQTPPSNGSSPFDDSLAYSSWLCNQRCLQDYILLCCQVNGGGFRDKPSKYVLAFLVSFSSLLIVYLDPAIFITLATL